MPQDRINLDRLPHTATAYEMSNFWFQQVALWMEVARRATNAPFKCRAVRCARECNRAGRQFAQVA